MSNLQIKDGAGATNYLRSRGTGTDLNPHVVCQDDYWLNHALSDIVADFGDVVSPEAKNKDLLKFGRNRDVGTTKATIMTLPTGILNETYLTDNLITTVSSTSAADTVDIIIEGHTLAADNFTFVTQTVTLTGQTQVSLTTPLARISRIVNDGATDLVGIIYGYETDTSTAGVPATDAKVHIMVEAGFNNSEKAATTMSSEDYMILTSFYGDCLEKTAASASVHLEIRTYGKVFINKVDISANTGGRGVHEFKPYLIVPPNADIRLRAEASGAGVDVAGGLQGVLAKA